MKRNINYNIKQNINDNDKIDNIENDKKKINTITQIRNPCHQFHE